MIYEQILAILCDHPDGLTSRDILAEAKKQRINKLTDIAIVSKNIWALKELKRYVESKGDQGKNRTYHITPAGSAFLASIGSVKVINRKSAAPSLETKAPTTGNPAPVSLPEPAATQEEAARPRRKHPPAGIQANEQLMAEIKTLFTQHTVIPAITEKQAKITLLATLADLCLDTETGRLLKAIKADLGLMASQPETPN